MRLGSRGKKGKRTRKKARRNEKEKCPPDSVNFDPRASSILDSDVSHPVVDPYSSSEIPSSSSSSSTSSASSDSLRGTLIFAFFSTSLVERAASALTHCQKE